MGGQEKALPLRLLVSDQLLELLGNLLVPCVNFVLSNGGVNSLPA